MFFSFNRGRFKSEEVGECFSANLSFCFDVMMEAEVFINGEAKDFCSVGGWDADRIG